MIAANLRGQALSLEHQVAHLVPRTTCQLSECTYLGWNSWRVDARFTALNGLNYTAQIPIYDRTLCYSTELPCYYNRDNPVATVNWKRELAAPGKLLTKLQFSWIGFVFLTMVIVLPILGLGARMLQDVCDSPNRDQNGSPA